MYNQFTKTIAAISTARAVSALSIIRVSGDDALSICDKCVYLPSGKKVSDMESNTCKYCIIKSKDMSVIDTGIVSVFRAPKSATGENVVEITCHGGVLVSSLVLDRVYECGAIPALPGEFSRRAFSNGKMSLTQAEGISNLLYAQSEYEIKVANNEISGVLKNMTDEIYSETVKTISSIYAEIDFPDEGLEELGANEVENNIDNIIAKLQKLDSSYKTGKAIVEGVKTCICGKPNVGKSTLLNLLCREDRAIVTDISGTTRDIIKETVVCVKSKLILSDTAGIHSSNDVIESIGIKKASTEIENSEFVLGVFDSSLPLDDDDNSIIDILKEKKKHYPVLIVLNKTDLGKKLDKEYFNDFDNVIEICANNQDNYDKLASKIDSILTDDNFDITNDACITNARQHSSVKKALEHALSAKEALKNGTSFAGICLESLLSELGSLDGREVTIEIVDDIFSRFCVGK